MITYGAERIAHLDLDVFLGSEAADGLDLGQLLTLLELVGCARQQSLNIARLNDQLSRCRCLLDDLLKVGDEPVLLVLLDMRQGGRTALIVDLAHCILLTRLQVLHLALVHLVVVHEQVGQDGSLTLDLARLVLQEQLRLVVSLALTEGYHGAEEYGQRLLEDVLTDESASIYLRLALTHLVAVLNVGQLLRLVPKAIYIFDIFPPELELFQHLLQLDVGVHGWRGLLGSGLLLHDFEVVQVDLDSGTMRVLPEVL